MVKPPVQMVVQDFFQLKQSKLEKVQTFMTRIEESLSRIRARFPGRIANGKVDEYLKDCLFHGMHKSISDSICYLYDDKIVEVCRVVEGSQKKS